MFGIGFIGNYPVESTVLDGTIYGDLNELSGTLDPVPVVPMALEFTYLPAPPRPENLTYA